MEHAEYGFKKAVAGLISGFVISVVVSSFLSTNNDESLIMLFNLASLMIGIIQLERAKYWGLLYSTGYFFGIFIIGRYLMSEFEFMIYLLIIGFYVLQKIVRKIKALFFSF